MRVHVLGGKICCWWWNAIRFIYKACIYGRVATATSPIIESWDYTLESSRAAANTSAYFHSILSTDERKLWITVEERRISWREFLGLLYDDFQTIGTSLILLLLQGHLFTILICVLLIEILLCLGIHFLIIIKLVARIATIKAIGMR